MPTHPSSARARAVANPYSCMAVEPANHSSTALESAAAQLEMDEQVLFSGADVEQSPLQQRSVHKIVLSLLFIVSPVPAPTHFQSLTTC